MIRPPPIPPGGRVRVLTPAGPVTPALLELGLRRLAQWGFDVVIDDHTYARSPVRGYLAGPDEQRARALQAALDAPDIDAIIFSRGGYGTMRLLDKLDPSGLQAHPKLLVGFSDITALHLWFAHHGVCSLHGPVVKSFGLHASDPHDSLGELRRALCGARAGGFELSGLQTVVAGEASGRILGGNLSLVASMIASPHCPDINGQLLFLEDVGEQDYRLDRLFTTLRLSRLTRRPAGILLGDFTGCEGVYMTDTASVSSLVADLAAEFECPVVAGLPLGHGTRNVALPIGALADLDATHGLLHVREDAVAPATALRDR